MGSVSDADSFTGHACVMLRVMGLGMGDQSDTNQANPCLYDLAWNLAHHGLVYAEAAA